MKIRISFQSIQETHTQTDTERERENKNDVQAQYHHHHWISRSGIDILLTHLLFLSNSFCYCRPSCTIF